LRPLILVVDEDAARATDLQEAAGSVALLIAERVASAVGEGTMAVQLIHQYLAALSPARAL